MQKAQISQKAVEDGVFIRGLVSHPVEFELRALSRKLRNDRGWDYGITFQQVIRSGIQSLKASSNV